MNRAINREWILNHRPVGDIADGDLVLRESPLPSPKDGEVLIRTTYLSLDPANRVWMSDMEQFLEPVRVGDPMRGLVLGDVVESRADGFKAEDHVMAIGTWSDYLCGPATNFMPVPHIPGLDVKDVFGIYFVVGPTAYFGLVDVGTPKAGETLLVSAAAGAVGSLVGQIGKSLGCRVVGIAGGPQKCNWIKELGFDAAVDYKSEDVKTALRTHCPAGVDIYFDTVGGSILDAAVGRMNLFGRIVLCGLTSTYNATEPISVPTPYQTILMRRLKVRGFIILDYLPRYPEAFQALTRLHAAGKLKWRFHEVQGLENAAKTVRLFFHGGNYGKLLIKVD